MKLAEKVLEGTKKPLKLTLNFEREVKRAKRGSDTDFSHLRHFLRLDSPKKWTDAWEGDKRVQQLSKQLLSALSRTPTSKGDWKI